MKLQQFLALPIGTELKGFKKRFVVKSRSELDGIEQPSLIDIDTGEPLFGAIYIPHLLSLDAQGLMASEESLEPQHGSVLEVGQDESRHVESQAEDIQSTVPVQTHPEEIRTDEPVFDPMVDVEDYSKIRLSFASEDVCLMDVTAKMIKHQPAADEYADLLKAL